MSLFNHSHPLVKLAITEAARRAALIDYGGPGWSDPIAERYGFTAARSAGWSIRVDDLLAYPRLRYFLIQKYALSTFEAGRWFRELPDAETYTPAERREGLKALRFFSAIEVMEAFLRDVVRRRQ